MPPRSLKGNRGQCAFSFIFIKNNWWQVDCGWNLREKRQSHILTYFKLRNPSSTGTSAIHHLKNLSFESTNCRHANSLQPAFKGFKGSGINYWHFSIWKRAENGFSTGWQDRGDRGDRNCPSRTWLRRLGGLCATSSASIWGWGGFYLLGFLWLW